MDKMERGRRNLAKIQSIAESRPFRSRMTFWNPTEDDQTTLTVYQCDVRPISLVYNQLNQQNADNMISQLATVSGFYKMLEFCWSKVEFRGTQI
jgi:hypothetical protein